MSARQALGIVEFVAQRVERRHHEDRRLTDRMERDASDDSMLGSAEDSDVAADIYHIPRMATPDVEDAFSESFDGTCEWLFTGGEDWAAIDRRQHCIYHRMAPVLAEVILGYHLGADIQLTAGYRTLRAY